jgi:single-stranded-DNA-specific exonuclease
MNWKITGQLPTNSPHTLQQIIEVLLHNRQIGQESHLRFLTPLPPDQIEYQTAHLDPNQLKTATNKILETIANNEEIVIYGDYDADGVSSTAILWLALHTLSDKVHPFIPHRERHGYGLSLKGVKEVIDTHHPKLIITVDNGIVAHEACEYIAGQGIDLIITDHHQLGKTMPKAQAIVHSTDICGAGVAWFLAKYLAHQTGNEKTIQEVAGSLDLLAIGTIADLMPMTGINRSFAKYGLEQLTKTQRPGLIALKQEAGILDMPLSSYHVGFIIAPRINAMGRLEYGMDALRLLCTNNQTTAKQLATTLSDTNKTRQDITWESFTLAEQIYQQNQNLSQSNIIIIDHGDFHEGIIGLIAGKLTEKYYKPSIVISRGEEISKASARSVSGVNIIELIRMHQPLLINAGGHPGAAGFTLKTDMIDSFRQELIRTATSQITPDQLTPVLNIDCLLDLDDLNYELFNALVPFEPFGLDNPKPTFALTAKIMDLKAVGKEQNHLKMRLMHPDKFCQPLDAIGFNLGHFQDQFLPGQNIELAANLDTNTWNGHTSLQLIVKDIRPPAAG